MTREEVLVKLRKQRAEFDARVAAIPEPALDAPIPGHGHTPKQIVAHVTAYERLIVERLRAARLGEETAFDRDRVGWEAFNERVWLEASRQPVDVVLASASRTFLSLLEEIATLAEADLAAEGRMAAAIDPAWLQGRSLADVIGVDGFEHYPMHFGQLEAAASA